MAINELFNNGFKICFFPAPSHIKKFSAPKLKLFILFYTPNPPPF